MGRLIVIEGVDGAGKNTLARRLVSAWEREHLDVVRIGFPRYDASVHADLAAEALRGEHGDTAQSVHAMALLFALDRRSAAGELRNALSHNDIVLLDRYVASNAAYTAARLDQSADGEAVEWIRALEFDRFQVPIPDTQIFLDVSVELAASRAESRETADASRTRDAYERDGSLQSRTAAVYGELAASNWMSPWQVVGADVDPDRLAADVFNQPTDAGKVTT
ncbi:MULTISPECIES: dTMP kinase [Nocardiaceae]|uniref:dTMP kinase n=1 Tax=Nocardiaceae TaxID=85025 RepID=UPI00055C7AE0|nr:MULTISPECIES: dTMP kinase [Rhodococcus]OZF07262.1 thymidylate kinase [Rhodococcus sp. 15-1189-1-1a]OZF22786.1 thymidylate kinase [Rhodococcus sp. 14-2686-1-2]OZF58587.1 thymidylate kinase [Rhodococcus sp. 14-2470-1b]